ncbi:MAG: hypothetical protein SPI62_00665 [Candidatus Enteromonas sp.]|nr:hypothetical protein [Candidatus Enteromonas sp.]
MAKGIIYVCSTVVEGLVKIGKAGSDNFEQRMYNLEKNGYRNVTGLHREFAIEVDNFDDIEILLDDIFAKSRVGGTELFSLDINKVIQLLSAFKGKQVYPLDESQEEVFKKATDAAQSTSLLPDGTYTYEGKSQKGIAKFSGVMESHNGKLVLKAGSKLAPLTSTRTSSWMSQRKALGDGSVTLAHDVDCTSVSVAGYFVCGHEVNGWNVWKNGNGEAIDVYRQKAKKEGEE